MQISDIQTGDYCRLKGDEHFRKVRHVTPDLVVFYDEMDTHPSEIEEVRLASEIEEQRDPTAQHQLETLGSALADTTISYAEMKQQRDELLGALSECRNRLFREIEEHSRAEALDTVAYYDKLIGLYGPKAGA